MSADSNAMDEIELAAELADKLNGAARRDDLNAVRRLIKAGANPSIWGADMQETAAHAAARVGSLHALVFLFQSGADLSVADCDGLTPMEAALTEGHDECVIALLEAGMDPNIRSRVFDLLTYSAYWGGSAFNALIEAGACVQGSSGNFDGLTPLHRAAQGNCFEACSVLLGAGADINVRDHGGATPLDLKSGALLSVHEAFELGRSALPGGKAGGSSL